MSLIVKIVVEDGKTDLDIKCRSSSLIEHLQILNALADAHKKVIEKVLKQEFNVCIQDGEKDK